MFKKFYLFICLAAMMLVYTVTANAFALTPVVVEEHEPEETVVSQTEIRQIEVEEKKIDTLFLLEAIPYETIIVETDDLPVGERVVASDGYDGEMLVVKRITVLDNVSNTSTSSEKVVKEPSPEIIHLGTGKNVIKTEDGYLKYTEKIEMSATAYCLCKKCTGKVPGQKGYGITASGIPAAYGVIAVDPKVIPLGTKLYVEGYGVSIAGDTGSGIVGNRIDLFYDDTAFTEKFGRQPRTVYILAN